MKALVEAALALVARVSPGQVEAVAAGLPDTPDAGRTWNAEDLVTSSLARALLDSLIEAWRASGASREFLAGLLVGAAHARSRTASETKVDLVWTGPSTRFVSTRRTDQVLLDLVRHALEELFVVSFVAHDVPFVVEALEEASQRGVAVRLLLESPVHTGGTLGDDAFRRMREVLPNAALYAWWHKEPPFTHGRVHAKVAVADGRIALVSSANLTGYALGRNMEAGVRVEGGWLPEMLHAHLRALIETGVIHRV